MRGKILVTVDNGERVRDYLMTSEEADKVFEALCDTCEVNCIALSDTPHATAEEVISFYQVSTLM